MHDWPRRLTRGTRGRILLELRNSFPITRLDVRIGSDVVARVHGEDLRDLAGMYFPVPSGPGSYPMDAVAEDSVGCVAMTSPRTLSVR